MQKISSQKIAQVLEDAQNKLLSLTSERDDLAQKVAMMERHGEASKLASVMHDKGIRMDTDYGDLLEELEKAAEDGRLPIIKEAVDMVAPNMGGMSGSLSSDERPGNGGTSFESYILGDVG